MTTHMSKGQYEMAPQKLAERGMKGCKINFLLWIMRRVHMCSKGLFRHVKARGNGTVIWVANDDADFDELHETFGNTLDGLMTDYPTNLANWAKGKRE